MAHCLLSPAISRRCAMAKPLRWNDLKIGILSTVGVIAAALAVLIFGRVGRLHGSTFSLFVSTKEARGVIRGTEVWLDGQKVGLVRGVSFQSPSVGENNRLVLSLQVLESARPHIRRDTKVQVRSGATVIGDQVVFMSSGTARMGEVAHGDTIRSTAQMDYEGVGAQAAEAGKELPVILANVKVIGAQLRAVNGTLGAFGVDEGSTEMRRVRAKASRLMSRFSESDGTVGLFLDNSDLLAARAKHAMAATDSIRALVASADQHSLGRFRRDTTLATTITKLRANIADLQRRAADPNGSVGRFQSDTAITHGLHRALAALDSLMADMKKHPLRYNPF
jgi:phospholipid/cholesterol/gamma-HCH transport system substrate-binding protein